MSDSRSPNSPTGPSNGPARPGEIPGTAAGGPEQPRSEKQIDQLLDVYAQLFKAANREHGGSPATVPRSSRLEPPPVPKAPVAPETLAQSGLSLMQVCDLILKQLYLLCRINIRRADHGGIDAEICGALLDSLFKGIEPGNARDLDDRDHFLLGLRKGKTRKTGTGQRGGTTHQLECLASVHCSLPGNDFSFRSLDRHTPGGSSQLHF
jgi:hypothetical protein